MDTKQSNYNSEIESDNIMANKGNTSSQSTYDKVVVDGKAKSKSNYKKRKSRKPIKSQGYKLEGSNQYIVPEDTSTTQLVSRSESILVPKTLTGLVTDFDKTTISVLKNRFRIFDGRIFDSRVTAGFYREFVDRYLTERGINFVTTDSTIETVEQDLFTIRNASFEAFALLLTWSRKYSCTKARDIGGDSTLGKIFSNDLVHRFSNLPSTISCANANENNFLEFDYIDFKISNAVWMQSYISLFTSFYSTPSAIKHCRSLFQDYLEVPQDGKISIFIDNIPEYGIGNYLQRMQNLKEGVDNILNKNPWMRGLMQRLGYINLGEEAMTVMNDLSRTKVRIKADDSINSTLYNWPYMWLTSMDGKIHWISSQHNTPAPNEELSVYDNFKENDFLDEELQAADLEADNGYNPDPPQTGLANRNLPVEDVDSFNELKGQLFDLLGAFYEYLERDIFDYSGNMDEPAKITPAVKMLDDIVKTEKPHGLSSTQQPGISLITGLTKTVDEIHDKFIDIIAELIKLMRTTEPGDIMNTLDVSHFFNKIENLVVHRVSYFGKVYEVGIWYDYDLSNSTIVYNKTILDEGSVRWLNIYDVLQKLMDINYYHRYTKNFEYAEKGLRLPPIRRFAVRNVGRMIRLGRALQRSNIPPALRGQLGNLAPIITAATAVSEAANVYSRVRDNMAQQNLSQEEERAVSFDRQPGESDDAWAQRLSLNYNYTNKVIGFNKSAIYSLKHLRSWNVFSVDEFLSQFDTSITLNDFAIMDRFRLYRPSCNTLYNLNRTNNKYKIVPRQLVITGRIGEDVDEKPINVDMAVNFTNVLANATALGPQNMFFGIYRFNSVGASEIRFDFVYQSFASVTTDDNKFRVDIIEDMNSIAVFQYDYYRELCKTEVFHPGLGDTLLNKLEDIGVEVLRQNIKGF